MNATFRSLFFGAIARAGSKVEWWRKVFAARTHHDIHQRTGATTTTGCGDRLIP
jgi:hypothetical protein